MLIKYLDELNKIRVFGDRLGIKSLQGPLFHQKL